MPGSDEESYRGWSIEFDITCNFETNLWTARAAVVSPSEASEVPSVHSLPSRDDFATENEARGYIIGEARR